MLGSLAFVTSEKWGQPSAQFRDIRPVFQSPGGRGGKMEIKESSYRWHYTNRIDGQIFYEFTIDQNARLAFV